MDRERGSGGWLGAASRRLLTAAMMMTAAPLGASAQQILPTPNPDRDCQTVRTCNFSRTSSVRGCLSSYSCRTCKLVRTRCNLAGRTYCQQLVCSWGG